MKALVMQQAGSARDFKLMEVPTPTPGPGEVLVEIHYTALNRVDSAFRQGMYPLPSGFPAILAVDFAGVVAKAAEGSEGFSEGDEVFVHMDMHEGGGLAEYAVVPVAKLVKKPEGLALAEAATLGIAALTAYQLVNELAEVKAGDKVLVQGGTGGVGAFAVQFAKRNGAEVYATTSKDQALLKSLGVDRVINYKEEDAAALLAGQMDVLIDTSGHTNEVLATVKDGGRAFSAAGAFDEKETSARNIKAGGLMHRSDPAQMALMAELAAEGKLKVVIEKEYPFTETGIAEAYEHLDAGHTSGKLVVKVK